MTTKEELIQRVGEDLALVPIGQDLEQHDVLRIEACYNEVYQRVKTSGFAVWPLAGAIPELATPFVSLLMQEKLLTSYSVPESRYQRIKQDAGPNGDDAMRNLSEVILPEYESIDDATDY